MPYPSSLIGMPASVVGVVPAPAASRLPDVFAARDVLPLLASGRKAIAGDVVVYETTPAPARVVRLYHRASGRLVREVLTDSGALYAFERLADNARYYVVALDMQPGGQSADVADYLLPD